MSNPRIIFPFTRLPDTSFGKKAQSILDAINGNPYFPDPSPSQSELQAAIDLFTEAMEETRLRSRSRRRAEITELRVALEEMLVKLGVYVMQIAGGDREILITSGFDLAE